MRNKIVDTTKKWTARMDARLNLGYRLSMEKGVPYDYYKLWSGLKESRATDTGTSHILGLVF